MYYDINQYEIQILSDFVYSPFSENINFTTSRFLHALIEDTYKIQIQKLEVHDREFIFNRIRELLLLFKQDPKSDHPSQYLCTLLIEIQLILYNDLSFFQKGTKNAEKWEQNEETDPDDEGFVDEIKIVNQPPVPWHHPQIHIPINPLTPPPTPPLEQ